MRLLASGKCFWTCLACNEMATTSRSIAPVCFQCHRAMTSRQKEEEDFLATMEIGAEEMSLVATLWQRSLEAKEQVPVWSDPRLRTGQKQLEREYQEVERRRRKKKRPDLEDLEFSKRRGGRRRDPQSLAATVTGDTATGEIPAATATTTAPEESRLFTTQGYSDQHKEWLEQKRMEKVYFTQVQDKAAASVESRMQLYQLDDEEWKKILELPGRMEVMADADVEEAESGTGTETETEEEWEQVQVPHASLPMEVEVMG